MTHGEAMKLARELIGHAALYGNPKATKIDALCDYILSGDMKREIENAAFERAVMTVRAIRINPPYTATIVRDGACDAIRALIQPAKPTAQQESVE